ncbi:uncharacterized protein BJ171DRAFT_143943 [Polychytrium aggregatum]|uniref:uncharacterized protein n=1 Tax=Polychytrium aggregatum TaxID=110093 RepID=UPI0022FDE3B1|nr:uncharacterized protein BJ171DRAFT_143943 [Polychytrium aggregatum]KAI9203439.1 hypothetical protein BJ171DRAFT_143943 [Polychytrium aggregatum]
MCPLNARSAFACRISIWPSPSRSSLRFRSFRAPLSSRLSALRGATVCAFDWQSRPSHHRLRHSFFRASHDCPRPVLQSPSQHHFKMTYDGESHLVSTHVSTTSTASAQPPVDPLGRHGHELYPFRLDSGELPSLEQLLASIRLRFEERSTLHAGNPPLKLGLLVGRGTDTSSWWLTPIPSPVSKHSSNNHINAYPVLWVCCDRFGGAFGRAPVISRPELQSESESGSSKPALHPAQSTVESLPPHLWMDFNSTTALAQIPPNFFDVIAVDWSTWRYLRPADLDVITEWTRILKPCRALSSPSSPTGGCAHPPGTCGFLFEGSVSSICYQGIPRPPNAAPSWQQLGFEYDNPSHITIPSWWADVLSSLSTIPANLPQATHSGAPRTKPLRSPLQRVLAATSSRSVLSMPRTIIPAPPRSIEPSLEAAINQIHPFLVPKCADLFTSHGYSVTFHSRSDSNAYPIPTRGVIDCWFQAIRRPSPCQTPQ